MAAKPVPRLLNPRFQGVNRLFVLSFPGNTVGAGRTNFFIASAEIKKHNFMIDGQNYFDQSVKNIRRMYNNILKIAIDQGDGYTTGCLVFCPYCNEHFKVITIYFMLIIRTRCCPGSNTANQFYCKSRLSWKHNNVFHY